MTENIEKNKKEIEQLNEQILKNLKETLFAPK